MVSFELDGTHRRSRLVRIVARYFTLAESLGGVKALICHPATMTHASIPAEARAELGLSDTLLRLSPGCENSEDLVEDLLEGLAEIASARASRRAGRRRSAVDRAARKNQCRTKSAGEFWASHRLRFDA